MPDPPIGCLVELLVDSEDVAKEAHRRRSLAQHALSARLRADGVRRRSRSRWRLAIASRICVHALSHLVTTPRQEVAIDIEGRLDFRVAHKLLDRLRVGTGVDISEAKVWWQRCKLIGVKSAGSRRSRSAASRSRLFALVQARLARPSTVEA